jgi:protease I
MAQLSNVRAAIFATDGFEESELTEPLKALRDAGAQVHIISNKSGKIQAFRHHDKSIQVPVDLTLDRANPENYQVLMLPGGALNADAARIQPLVQEFVRSFDAAGKPMAVICHAPWLLVSAGLVKGRTLTSYKTIQDDIRNAGGNWVDQEVVVDQNWVTSRQPKDLPAFNREMINMISAYQAKIQMPKAA